MSSKEIQRIVCPKCGAEHDFEVWSRINTELDPDSRSMSYIPVSITIWERSS